MEEALMSPVIQYGFAGFSLVLVGVIVWLIKQLLAVLKENTQALQELRAVVDRGNTQNIVMERLIRRILSGLIKGGISVDGGDTPNPGMPQ